MVFSCCVLLFSNRLCCFLLVFLQNGKVARTKVKDADEALQKQIKDTIRQHGCDPDKQDIEAWSAKVLLFLKEFDSAVEAHKKREEMKASFGELFVLSIITILSHCCCCCNCLYTWRLCCGSMHVAQTQTHHLFNTPHHTTPHHTTHHTTPHHTTPHHTTPHHGHASFVFKCPPPITPSFSPPYTNTTLL